MADTPIPLEVRDITKRFGDTEVLKGLSLRARKGDVITLIGASGSGKSTFLRCMNLLEQRGAIARAFAMEPEVMLFDEPTSALDPELVGYVLKVMRDLAEEGRTMIVVTHEMAFARDVSSEVIYLHQGRVEEAGPPGEVLDHPRSPRLRQFLAPKHWGSTRRLP